MMLNLKISRSVTRFYSFRAVYFFCNSTFYKQTKTKNREHSEKSNQIVWYILRTDLEFWQLFSSLRTCIISVTFIFWTGYSIYQFSKYILIAYLLKPRFNVGWYKYDEFLSVSIYYIHRMNSGQKRKFERKLKQKWLFY